MSIDGEKALVKTANKGSQQSSNRTTTKNSPQTEQQPDLTILSFNPMFPWLKDPPKPPPSKPPANLKHLQALATPRKKREKWKEPEIKESVVPESEPSNIDKLKSLATPRVKRSKWAEPTVPEREALPASDEKQKVWETMSTPRIVTPKFVDPVAAKRLPRTARKGKQAAAQATAVKAPAAKKSTKEKPADADE